MKKMLAAALLFPSVALAHSGHEVGSPFLAGLAHPVGGVDHLLAMLAVGLWAASVGGAALWTLPAAFVTAMIAGGALGAAHIALPMVEPMILASSVVIGAAVATAVRPSLSVMQLMVVAFGIVHGHAHGAEGPAAGLATYALGFVLATAALHGVGQLLGRLPLVRWMGAATAAAGLIATVA